MNTEVKKITKKRRKEGTDYIDNKELSNALAVHVQSVKAATDENREPPQINDYIAKGILQIANGLSRSPNFMNYSYRDDMVMDAVENCVKVINNFDINAKTRTGTPNAFSYFTQICFFAFLRRIAKEKKQSDIKQKLIDKSSLDVFADFGEDSCQIGETLIERVRQRNEFYNEDKCSNKGEEPLPTKKRRGRPAKKMPEFGPLDEFFESEAILDVDVAQLLEADVEQLVNSL
jgi:hypothetical protein